MQTFRTGGIPLVSNNEKICINAVKSIRLTEKTKDATRKVK